MNERYNKITSRQGYLLIFFLQCILLVPVAAQAADPAASGQNQTIGTEGPAILYEERRTYDSVDEMLQQAKERQARQADLTDDIPQSVPTGGLPADLKENPGTTAELLELLQQLTDSSPGADMTSQLLDRESVETARGDSRPDAPEKSRPGFSEWSPQSYDWNGLKNSR